jgi:hypothetical protein
MSYPKDMDPECISLCDAINLIIGIETYESCSGHNKTPFRIWFTACDISLLPDLLYWFNGCHSGYYQWSCKVKTDCGRSPVRFLIEGPVGDYEASYEIAKLITKDQQTIYSSRDPDIED